jgi:transposase, IS30 family
MSLPPRREAVRSFWLAYLAGASKEEAAVGAGVRGKTGAVWFRQAGGVVPAYVAAKLSGRYLCIAEREEIFAGVERGDSIRQIAKCLGRAPSTVLRELRDNMWHQLYRARQRGGHGMAVSKPWNYRPSVAQSRADVRARRPKVAKLASNLQLRQLVQAKLTARLSPEQTAAQLKREFLSQPEMWVSHETIYQSLYVQGRGALRRELAVCLRTGRALRRPRRKSDQRRPRISGMVSISERPAEVEDRAVPGHWEGDLLMGKAGRSAIGTLVERQTRFVMLLHLPRGKSALDVEQAMLAATQRLPRVLWKSLTWDRGSEMARHAEIKFATGLEIYFCDPAKPWQRGSNENTNGLLRQYFPKTNDFTPYTVDDLDTVAAEMNSRPRKTLGWDSPAEALERLLSTMSSTASVATTD